MNRLSIILFIILAAAVVFLGYRHYSDRAALRDYFGTAGPNAEQSTGLYQWQKSVQRSVCEMENWAHSHEDEGQGTDPLAVGNLQYLDQQARLCVPGGVPPGGDPPDPPELGG